MSCQSCISVKKIIKVPRDLTEAILLVKLKKEDGTIQYKGHSRFADSFARISSGKGWSDYVDNYFSCVHCKQIIRLHAETYHGSGGALEAVKKVESELVIDE